MCGILGKINFNQESAINFQEIKMMAAAISHRGPDDEGIFIDKNIALAHRRLSIIDLSQLGHQPMSDSEKKIWITFNGEIYNYQELREELEKDNIHFKSKTDTEVIIYLYKKYGHRCLEKLRGMFAFAIWDDYKKELFLARDRIGKKPLKYFYDKNTFVFSSELKSILVCPEVKKEIDLSAIDDFITYQYIPHPKTGFKNIFKLPAGHYMVVNQNGKVTINKYWENDYNKKIFLSEEEWKEKALDKIKESIKIRLMADVPLGAHLSGGIDSGLVVALMAEMTNSPVKTFSIGFSEKEYNELPFAKLIAQKYKTDHTEFLIKPDALEILPEIIKHYEEPFADSSAIPTWYLCQMTKQQVTVALNGDGGDENFAGYDRYQLIKYHRLLKILPFKKLIKNTSLFFYRFQKNKLFHAIYKILSSYSDSEIEFYYNLISYLTNEEKNLLYTEEFKKMYSATKAPFANIDLDQIKDYSAIDKACSIDFNTYLPDDLMVKTDIASMAHGLETRSPLLDHELVELCSKIPAKLKINSHGKKYLLKQIAKDYLPIECINRPKQGFAIPLDYWFRGSLANSFEKQDRHHIFDSLFKKEEVNRLISDHHKHKKNNGKKIWLLLVLNQWLQLYFPEYEK